MESQEKDTSVNLIVDSPGNLNDPDGHTVTFLFEIFAKTTFDIRIEH